MKTILFVGFGFLFLALAAIGLLLPVWPTTPFVLVAAGCFSVAPRLRARLLRIGFFREYIESYAARRGLSKKTVLLSLAYLWGMLLASMLLVHQLWIVALLPAIGLAVTVHILCLARPKIRLEKEKGDAV